MFNLLKPTGFVYPQVENLRTDILPTLYKGADKSLA